MTTFGAKMSGSIFKVRWELCGSPMRAWASDSHGRLLHHQIGARKRGPASGVPKGAWERSRDGAS
jgi:hypothetical protein